MEDDVTQNRTFWEWQDVAGGFHRSQTWNNNSGFALGALEGVLSGISNAGLQFVTSAVPDVAISSPTADVTWQLTQDLAVILFDTASGGVVQLIVPAPHEGIFKPDTLVVDPGNAAIIALTAAAVASMTSVGGDAVTGFNQGVRSSRRTEQNMPPG